MKGDWEKIISRNAVVSSISRGKEIFRDNRVFDLKFNVVDGTIKGDASVTGSGGVYRAELVVANNDVVQSYCSCPYDWGGICKHRVASLLAIEQELSKNGIPVKTITRKAPSLKVRDTIDPFEMSLIGGIDLRPYESGQKYIKARNSLWNVEDIAVQENEITLSIRTGYHNEERSQVTIIPSKNGENISISSSPSKRIKGISDDELTALVYISYHRLGNIFNLTFGEKRDKLILLEATRYGITSLERAKEYFEINPRDFKRPVRLKSDQPQLIPLSGYDDTPVSFNDFITTDALIEKQFLLQEKKKPKESELFFCVHYQEYDNNYDILSIVPFVARKKENGQFYKSGIKRYFDVQQDDAIDLNDLNANLVELCKPTIPYEFSKRAGNTIRNVNDEQEELTLIHTKNLNSINELWGHFIDNNIKVFLNNPEAYTKRLLADDLLPIELMEERPLIEMELSCKQDMIVVSPTLNFGSKKHHLNSPDIQWLHPICGKIGSQLFLLNSANDAVFLNTAFGESKAFITVPEAFELFFNSIVSPISKNYPFRIESLPQGIEKQKIKMEVSTKKLYLKELDRFILMRPFVAYGEHEINALHERNGLVFKDNKLTEYERDREIEADLIGQIKQLHPKFENGTNHDFFSLHLDDFIKDYWFLGMFDKLKEEGIEVYGFSDFKNFNYSPHTPSIKVNASSGVDWFDLEVSVMVGDAKVSLKDVRKAILSKEKYLKLGDEKLAILPSEWVEKLEKYLRIGKVNKDKIQVSKLGFNALDGIFEELDQLEILTEIAEKRNKLKSFEKINKVAFPEINAELRDYQKEGFHWLHFLQEFGWGGILADDMGLGKTLQMITFLKSMVEKGIKKNLVVVPTSLLFNWQNEIEKFCPSLTYHIYHGSDRERKSREWEQYDLIITTYGLLVSDVDIFTQEKFGYIVLDESQAIKNPASKRFKAAVVLTGLNKIAMTGTPIENNTIDLYSQMAFVNPGLFISAEHFKKNYASPIDNYADKDAAAELNKIIHPFILRRTKEKVARELPEKTEDIIYCQMEVEQRKVYDAFRNKYRNEIQGLIEEGGFESSKLHVLQALTKMRQVCNSPALLNEESSYGNESVKIKELIRHIREKTGNHKILVFSQFVGMLTLIRQELDTLEIPYAYLDGKCSKKKRQEAVETFQGDDNIRVFLISLKAGGTGLNLEAADYVYIVDPWWNPAVENQAIDRCHRIGQDKKVIAYRMICKDTLEEKITSYKVKKQAVADAIIKTDESVMKKISKEEILELFS